MMRRPQLACLLALLVPLGAASAAIVSICAAERLGATPLSSAPRNSAEAAAMGSPANVLRFIRLGEDPTRVYPVRAEIISAAVLQATTLEAAMWSRQLELIQLLEREGAIVGSDTRTALACLAADLKVDDVVRFLAPDGKVPCEPEEALARVLARTSGVASR